ncbi:MAG: MATE family efflux transporter [Christensenellales bacterium]
MLERVKQFFAAQDMTTGKPMRNITKFAVPLLIGNLAQQLYSTVDSIVVGKYCTVEVHGYDGVDALAAIGVSTPILFLLMVLFISVGTGAGILVAQYFGARDKDNLARCVGTSLVLTTIVSILVTAIGVPLAGPLLRLINTPAAYYEIARAYLQILLIGIIGSGFYNIVSGILRGLGDAFYPLLFLVISALLNIVLDLWFVIGFEMGVSGVAWATIIAQAVSAILCLIRLRMMKNLLVLKRGDIALNRVMSGKILRIGLPSGLTQGIFSLAMVFVQSLTNQMGNFVPAISMAVMRVDGFAMLPNFTFGLAISTYIGQNIGAGKIERVKPGERAVLKLALSCSVALVILLVIWGRQLIGLFLNPETTDPAVYAKVLSLGGNAQRILAIGYVGMAITQIYGGILRAAGDTMSTMYISIITTVVLRVPLTYGIAYLTRSEEWAAGHPYALFVSMLVSWLLGALLTYLRFRQGKWKNIKLVEQH